MKTTKARPGFGKLRIAYLFMILAAIGGCGSYGWRVYTLFRDARLNIPQTQIEKLVKDLRLFHSRTNRFPKSFNEINHRIWRTQPKPDYGTDGRQARAKNYYYFYTRVDDWQCAIWAIPLGPSRDYAYTYFLVITPNWERIWRGKAFDETAISTLPSVHSENELTSLQLIELPARTFSRRPMSALN